MTQGNPPQNAPGRTIQSLLLSEPATNEDRTLTTWFAQFLVRLAGYVGPAGGASGGGNTSTITDSVGSLQAGQLVALGTGGADGATQQRIYALENEVTPLPPFPAPRESAADSPSLLAPTSSLVLTDGSGFVSSVERITVSGATVSGKGGLATLAVSGGGSSLPDLLPLPVPAVLSASLDQAFGQARGNVLYRGQYGWAALGPGTSGYFLKTQGAGADPVWAAGGGGGGGSAQGPTFGNRTLSCPPLSDFTVTNQGSATLEDIPGVSAGALAMMTPRSSAIDWLLVEDAVTGTWERVALVEPQFYNANYEQTGLAVGDGTGKFVSFTQSINEGVIQCQNWSDVNTYNSNFGSLGTTQWGPRWMRAAWDGSNLTFGLSANGIYFDAIFTIPSGAYIGAPTFCAWGSQKQGSGPATFGAYLWNWTTS